MGKYQSSSTEPLMGGRHKYNEVLSSALWGLLAALPLLPQRHVALGMMSCALAWVDHGHYPPLQWGCQGLDFGGVTVCEISFNIIFFRMVLK